MILPEDEEQLLENSIVCTVGSVDNFNCMKRNTSEGTVNFNCIKRNTSEGTVACSFLPRGTIGKITILGFGLWVHLPLVSSASRYNQSTNMIENIRSYNFGFSVLGQWRRSY
jgi:hypothetical protein